MHPGQPRDLTRANLNRLQADGLSALLAAILPQHRFYDHKFRTAGLSPAQLSFPGALALLPFTTKAELLAAQADSPPHGGLISVPFDRCTRMHQTSGTSGRPLRWYDTNDSWSAVLDTWLEFFHIIGLR